jgi:hypothetical protein
MFHEDCLLGHIDMKTKDGGRGQLRERFEASILADSHSLDYLRDYALPTFDAAATGREAALFCVRILSYIPGIQCPTCRREICWLDNGELRPDHPTFAAGKLCATCSKPAKNVCGGCKSIRYCSVECQRADWTRHKVECHDSSRHKGERHRRSL